MGKVHIQGQKWDIFFQIGGNQRPISAGVFCVAEFMSDMFKWFQVMVAAQRRVVMTAREVLR